jgi:hypothetical protein
VIDDQCGSSDPSTAEESGGGDGGDGERAGLPVPLTVAVAGGCFAVVVVLAAVARIQLRKYKAKNRTNQPNRIDLQEPVSAQLEECGLLDESLPARSALPTPSTMMVPEPVQIQTRLHNIDFNKLTADRKLYDQTERTAQQHIAQKARVELGHVRVRLSGGSVVVNAEVRSPDWSPSAAKAVLSAFESTDESRASLADVVAAIPSIRSVKENPDAPLTADEFLVTLPEMNTHGEADLEVPGFLKVRHLE